MKPEFVRLYRFRHAKAESIDDLYALAARPGLIDPVMAERINEGSIRLDASGAPPGHTYCFEIDGVKQMNCNSIDGGDGSTIIHLWRPGA